MVSLSTLAPLQGNPVTNSYVWFFWPRISFPKRKGKKFQKVESRGLLKKEGNYRMVWRKEMAKTADIWGSDWGVTGMAGWASLPGPQRVEPGSSCNDPSGFGRTSPPGAVAQWFNSWQGNWFQSRSALFNENRLWAICYQTTVFF